MRFVFIVIIILLCLAGYRLCVGFDKTYNYWAAKRDIRMGNVKIIVIGMPYQPQIEQEAAKKYGFHFSYIGCMVSEELVNSIQIYNRVVGKYLTEKYGTNFWKKFDNQIDSLSKAAAIDADIGLVTNIVSDLDIVKDKIQVIDSLSKGNRHVSIFASLKDTVRNIYSVKVAEDNGIYFATHLNFLVDAKKRAIVDSF